MSRHFVLAPPDDEGILFAPLLMTLDEAADILAVTRTDLQRLIDRGLVEIVHLGFRDHIRVKCESLRRAFGVRPLLMRPARAYTPDTPPHLRPQPPGRPQPPEHWAGRRDPARGEAVQRSLRKRIADDPAAALDPAAQHPEAEARPSTGRPSRAAEAA